MTVTKLTAVVQAGVSNQAYSRELITLTNQIMLFLKLLTLLGGYVKGGVNYNIDEKSNVFFNTGFISRQPLL
jgi:hypothetical protein